MIERNIYIVGAQSTGKTTLAKALYESFLTNSNSEPPCSLIKEVARVVVHDTGIDRDEQRYSPEKCFTLQELILKAQYEAELCAKTWYISDRSAADPLVYAHFHVDGKLNNAHGSTALEELVAKKEWQLMKERMKESLVIVTEPVSSFLQDDETRLVPLDEKEWWGFHHRFCHLLNHWGINYHVVSGADDMVDIEKRVQYVRMLYYGSQEDPIPTHI